MHTTYLIRHAEPLRNSGRPAADAPLSTRGECDAAALVSLLAGVPIEAVYSSPQRRARATVEPLARSLALPIVQYADFRERELGSSAGDFECAVRETWDDFAFAHPDGESNAVAQQRGVAAYRELIARHRDGTIALATHGNLLALVLRSFDPSIGFDLWKRLTLPHVFRLTLDSDRDARIVRLRPPAFVDPFAS